jgi:hypothetical protein
MFDAYTGASFGDGQAQPVIPNVHAALTALRAAPVSPGPTSDASQSYPFFYKPEVYVGPLAHIQGLARLGLPGFENWFVVSKHHHQRKQLGGILLLRWAKVSTVGRFFRLDASAAGAGGGRVQASIFGRALHPGGMQLCGGILAVAQTGTDEPAWVDFFNLQNPNSPSVFARLTLRPPLIDQEVRAITSVALTRSRAGTYLCFVYRYSSNHHGQHRGWLFESNMNVLNANTGWLLRRSFDAASFPDAWREPYESIAFVGQADSTLFLAGMRGFQTNNHVDLFRCSDGPIPLTYVDTKDVSTRSAGATFRAGASLFITRQSHLALYTSQMFGAGYGQLLMEEFSP